MNWQYPLVAFDLDGTLAHGPTFVWQLLHTAFPADDARRRWAHREYFAGRLSYADWFANDLMLLQAGGATRQGMLAAFARIRPMPGAVELLTELKRQGRKLAIISGSVDLLLHHLFPGFPFDHILINRLAFDPDGWLVGGTPTPYDLERKADGLAHLAQREGLSLDQCAFVGDQDNDLTVLRQAGLGIAFAPGSPRVAEAADVVLPGPNLAEALPHLT